MSETKVLTFTLFKETHWTSGVIQHWKWQEDDPQTQFWNGQQWPASYYCPSIRQEAARLTKINLRVRVAEIWTRYVMQSVWSSCTLYPGLRCYCSLSAAWMTPAPAVTSCKWKRLSPFPNNTAYCFQFYGLHINTCCCFKPERQSHRRSKKVKLSL
jgi:hypothetical protein